MIYDGEINLNGALAQLAELSGGKGGTVSVEMARYSRNYLAIVGPASIYNVKVNLIGELVELLEGEGRGHSVLK